MYETVRGMLENFLELVKRYGFVPNGGRIYYNGRSQPPLLTPMTKSYVETTSDYDFLTKALPLMDKEFQHWKNDHSVYVNGHRMYVYIERTCGPRPESYYEDILLASACKNDKERENMYSELKAAANSGMDFSSRWYVNENGTNDGDLKDLKTRSIVAVDLNAWMYYIAKILSDLYRKFDKSLNSQLKSSYYKIESVQIKTAIDRVLWDEEVGCWLDYDLINRKRRNYYVASNFVPLYVECYDSAKRQHISDKILKYIETNKLDSFVSLPNTLFKCENGQQWDYPNVWPPMQVYRPCRIFRIFNLTI